MSSKADSFRELGQRYTEYTNQFGQFAEAVKASVDTNPIPSLSITSSDNTGFSFIFLGRAYDVILECFARNDLISPQALVDPYIRFCRGSETRTLSLDKHGNVRSVESGNNIGNIQKDPDDVFFTVLASLARDSG